jgi:hypothetical protein
MELWVNELWLLGTAIVFTWVGFYISKWRAVASSEIVIDSLIDQGFLKTRGTGSNMEIIKWREWCDDQNSG